MKRRQRNYSRTPDAHRRSTGQALPYSMPPFTDAPQSDGAYFTLDLRIRYTDRVFISSSNRRRHHA